MTYSNIEKGIFIDRPNRFIAHVDVAGKVFVVHVKNTGRCKELLVPGCTVFLEKSDNPARKTLYDLVSVIKKCEDGRKLFINMDSQAPNKVAAEWIKSNKKRFPEITFFKPEYTYGDSRFDFYFEYNDARGCHHKMFLEVKGCTLEFDKVAMFPDAPTERGLKHVTELTEIHKQGEYECGVLLVIQMMGCNVFRPNWKTHKEFGMALRGAQKSGVEIFAVECSVSEDTLVAGKSVPVDLSLPDGRMG